MTASVYGSSVLGTASVHVESMPLGDVNCDGNITPGDALCAFWRAILGSFQEECVCPLLAKETSEERKTPDIYVGSVGGKPLDRIKVPILVADAKGLDAFAMQLTYPENLLEFRSVSPTPATKNWTALDGAVIKSGVVSIGGFNAESVSSEELGAIVEVSFTVKGGAKGGGEFGLTNLVDEIAGANVKKGSFIVRAVPTAYALFQNYQNPFKPLSATRWQMQEARCKTTLDPRHSSDLQSSRTRGGDAGG